jgi:hypothetical protein
MLHADVFNSGDLVWHGRQAVERNHGRSRVALGLLRREAPFDGPETRGVFIERKCHGLKIIA